MEIKPLYFEDRPSFRGLMRNWNSLALTTRRLLSARFWRSISQGALVVDLALFLHALDWRGAAIGLVLSAAGIAGAALNILVGVFSDRSSRKPFLIAYEVLSCACALLAMLSSDPVLLCVAIILAGFGRGANGAAGPFAPAEQAWLAETVAPERRGVVYSLNTAIGFFGMTLGALAAVLPRLLRPYLGQAGSFRPLFGLVLLGNAVNLLLLATAPEFRPRQPVWPATAPSVGAPTRERRFLWHLMGLNAFNGLAIGLTGPLISYWFARRFLIGPLVIGPILALSFLITGLAALMVGRLTQRAGLVRSVVWGRSGGLILLLILPFMPVYGLASLVYILRTALNRGTTGARQALVISAVREERRGFAASLNALSMQLPQSLGPAAAGALIGAGWFVMPFLIAAGLQGVYVLLYQRVFAPLERECADLLRIRTGRVAPMAAQGVETVKDHRGAEEPGQRTQRADRI
ncbi:MAG: MFS transporter [Desulfobacteraceae bacterium]|nr:MFS transporter [Desulfobacteraceae bacterium]